MYSDIVFLQTILKIANWYLINVEERKSTTFNIDQYFEELHPFYSFQVG